MNKQIDIIIDLLIDFDEMGFAPTTTCPDPEAYAKDWRNKLTSALQSYRKQEWISVDDRLPDHQCEVLAYYGFKRDGDDDLRFMMMGG